MDGSTAIDLAPPPAGESLEEIYRVALRAERAAWDRVQGHNSDEFEGERLAAWHEAAAWADAARDAFLASQPTR